MVLIDAQKSQRILRVKGDLLDAKVDVILQQTNCLTVRPHGLSETISKKYPYANAYGNRRAIRNRNLAVPEDRDVPGTVKWFYPTDQGPIVGCIFGQWQPGKAGQGYGGAYPCPPGCDKRETNEQRLQWFQQGLREITLAIEAFPENAKIGIPFKIGCGLAGGDWNKYEKMLIEWSDTLPENVSIIIYSL